MKKKLFIVAVLLLTCAVAWAAMDSEVKRRAAQGNMLPVADANIVLFDRAMLTGVYIADGNVAAPVEANSVLIRWHHHYHD